MIESDAPQIQKESKNSFISSALSPIQKTFETKSSEGKSETCKYPWVSNKLDAPRMVQ